MRAIRIHETGGPEVLRLEEVTSPEQGEGNGRHLDDTVAEALGPKLLPIV